MYIHVLYSMSAQFNEGHLYSGVKYLIFSLKLDALMENVLCMPHTYMYVHIGMGTLLKIEIWNIKLILLWI